MSGTLGGGGGARGNGGSAIRQGSEDSDRLRRRVLVLGLALGFVMPALVVLVGGSEVVPMALAVCFGALRRVGAILRVVN